MKQKYFNYLLVFALLGTTSLIAWENNFKERVRREVKKTFSVNPDALLEVNNSFGDLNITTWNNNTIDITVEIIVEGRSKSRSCRIRPRHWLDGYVPYSHQERGRYDCLRQPLAGPER